MDLLFNAEDQAFQEQVRHFIGRHWPPSLASQQRRPQDVRDRFRPRTEAEQAWFEALVEIGWSVPHWPVEHGGAGWRETQKYIWNRETTAAGCPQMSHFGARMLAPVIYTWGNKAQQERYLPPIREARVTWCQGYSEPGAGSDLASLATTAARDGDHYIVNGIKTWTTGAQVADWMFCLVRTDTQTEKRQQGISFILFDMKSEGVSVSPIITLGGQHSINQVTLDHVRVPIEQRIGAENQGWTYAKGLLTHERIGIAGIAQSQVQLKKVKAMLDDAVVGGAALAEDDDFTNRLLQLEIELSALEMTELRVLSQISEGGTPEPAASILKIKGTEITQRLYELAVEAHGYYALPYPPHSEALDNEGPIGPESAVPAISGLMSARAHSIFGGTNEIQRNIIAKTVLDL